MGRPVSIWCHGSRKADRYHLHQKSAPRPWRTVFPRGPRDKAEFPIPLMTHGLAGRYHCTYGSRRASSAPSEPLDLVVTALLPQDTLPTLSAHPGPTMAPGENVTLQCQTGSLFDTFLLFKEGDISPPLNFRSQYQDGVFQANFPMSPVTLDHGGTYRCYGSLSGTPVQLSRPSNPLELKVEGDPVNITPSVQTPNSTSGPQASDYTVENLIAMGLSGLILGVLGVLVFHAWYSERRSPGIN
ncbi:leukocyte immunoglobulin-like receptor subfamily A member 6 [Eptesicus fuscus]|uniref:leukocyte immunoglobulin-like receptor subfamily A member 6 n=1 Tax=Eptesicus fuscus TaxID=29078 RepID=UPI0024042101|nr:leukocyte immunoglobulin-like receptor subfamily A member 6 [Eptesicus fuscus]